MLNCCHACKPLWPSVWDEQVCALLQVKTMTTCMSHWQERAGRQRSSRSRAVPTYRTHWQSSWPAEGTRMKPTRQWTLTQTVLQVAAFCAHSGCSPTRRFSHSLGVHMLVLPSSTVVISFWSSGRPASLCLLLSFEQLVRAVLFQLLAAGLSADVKRT